MDPLELARLRLKSQQLLSHSLTRPEEVLTRMVAVQGQDYPGAKWSIGVRLPGCTDEEVEQALAQKKILRSWVLRGTLHLVGPQDIGWLLELLAPHIISSSKRRYRQLDLDEPTLSRSNDLIVRALQENGELTRRELFADLDRHNISPAGQRGIHMLQRASLERLICQGNMHSNNPTFILLEGIPARHLAREEALAELAGRYFATRGPATLADYTWWSGLAAAEARTGLEAVESQFASEEIDGRLYWFSPELSASKSRTAFLLSGYDEFLLAYKDRSASMRTPHYNRLTPTNGMLPGTLVIDGRVLGTWKRTFKKKSAEVWLNPFHPLSDIETKAITRAAEQWGDYIGLPIHLAWF